MIEIAMPGELSRRAEPPGISRRGYHAGISRGDITGTVNRSPKQHPAVHRIIVHR
ncbi:hypothetical protein [Mobiluncus mulieris]|uniref:hypothetical protein n=1 Tax=Mobiluncus mulieris TaxID=2052 RepID=UPI0015F0724B|nr:hypothetical protein [Mobiluncus mulieris]